MPKDKQFLTPTTCDICDNLMLTERPNLPEYDPPLDFCQQHGGSGILLDRHTDFLSFAKEHSILVELPLPKFEEIRLASDYCILINNKRMDDDTFA